MQRLAQRHRFEKESENVLGDMDLQDSNAIKERIMECDLEKQSYKKRISESDSEDE